MWNTIIQCDPMACSKLITTFQYSRCVKYSLAFTLTPGARNITPQFSAVTQYSDCQLCSIEQPEIHYAAQMGKAPQQDQNPTVQPMMSVEMIMLLRV